MKKNIVKMIIGMTCIMFSMTGCEKVMVFQRNQEESMQEESMQEEKTYVDPMDYSIDILKRYNLPDFSRMDADDQEKYVNNLQIMKKIQALDLKKEDFIYPEQNMESVKNTVDEKKKNVQSLFTESVAFNGNTSAELQKCIDANINKTIEIQSASVDFDTTVIVPSNTCIKGNGVKITMASKVDSAFLVENKENVIVSGLQIEGGFQYGIYAIDARNIEIFDCSINSLEQKPVVVVGNCEYVMIHNNDFEENQNGGVYFDGNINYGEISSNIIKNNYGTSNWMAGIVLCGVEIQNKKDIWEKFDENHHFPQKDTLYSEINCPHNIIVSDNYVENNNASGIYGDGAYLCYLTGNMVRNNDKEGICLDYGSFGCYLYDNTFEGNGRRINQTDKDLEMDFVLGGGRLEDGSAKSKLPAISLDNTAYNVLLNNVVSENYGGGIKMVRTTVRCLIAENIVKNNNMGQSDDFHFFGIELGSAIADAEATEMDFTADYENIICRNTISGNHYSGVFIGEGGYVNDVFDNVIMQAQMFSVEAVSTMFNSIVNNVADKDVRNEYVAEK